MTETTVRTNRHGPVLFVELNRPDRLNAFDWAMREELHRLWTDLATDGEIRAIVLTGAGRGFCAGADIEALSESRRPMGNDVHDELGLLPGRHIDVPVIVAVNGACAGGGLHFVADADIAIAGESASFVDPHVSVGQVSALEPVSLALRVPIPHLLRMALLGREEKLSADEALKIGLVTEVVPSSELLDRAFALAEAVAANSPAAVAATRRAVRSLEHRLLDAAMEEGWSAVQAHWSHPDSREGPAAFAERRVPAWAARRVENES